MSSRNGWALGFLAVLALLASTLVLLGSGVFGGGTPDAGPRLGNDEEARLSSGWLDGGSGGRGGERRAGDSTTRVALASSGVVVDERGEPVANAEVILYARANELAAALEAASKDGGIERNADRVRALLQLASVNGPGRVEPQEYEVVQKWICDREGRFDLGELPPTGDLYLDARGGDRVLAGILDRKDLEARAGEPLRLVLADGLRLSGVVRAKGVPVPEVLVSLSAQLDPQGRRDPIEVRQATTDAEGRYTLHGLRPGAPYLPTFTLEHYFAGQEQNALGFVADFELDHELIAFAELRGTVLDLLGNPSPGAEVELRGLDFATADEEGRFTFYVEVHETQELEIFARSDDETGLAYEKLLLSVSEQRDDYVVELGRASSIRGRVVDRVGVPVPGATVNLAWTPESGTEQLQHEFLSSQLHENFRVNALRGLGLKLTSDFSRNGEISFQIAPGTFEVAAQNEPVQITHAIQSAPWTAHTGGGSGPGPVQFVFSDGTDGGFIYSGLEHISWGNPPFGPTSIFVDNLAVVADDEGHFEFTGLWPGRYVLSASHPECLESEQVTLTVQGEDKDSDVTLPRGASLEGTVFDASGKPVGKSHISVFREGSLLVDTDAQEDGTFRVQGLESGPLVLFAEAPDLDDVGRLTGLYVEAGSNYPGSHIHLGPGAEFAARVVDPSGKPVPNTFVRLSSQILFGRDREGRTDNGGNCILRGLFPGEHAVHVEAEGFLTQSFDGFRVDGAMSHEFRLERGAVVAGKVRGPNGEPIPGAHVFLFSGPGEDQTQTREDGSYSFTDVHPGACEIFVRTNDYGLEGRLSTRVETGGEHTKTDVFLIPPAVVVGRVVDAEGKGVPGVRVNGHTDPGGQGARQTRTGPDGSFRLPRLYPDRYRIYLNDPGKGQVLDCRGGGEFLGVELRLEG